MPSTLHSGSFDLKIIQILEMKIIKINKLSKIFYQLNDLSGFEDCGTFLLIFILALLGPSVDESKLGGGGAIGGGGPGGGGGAGGAGGGGTLTRLPFPFCFGAPEATVEAASDSDSLCLSSMWRAASVSSFSLVRSKLASTSSFS